MAAHASYSSSLATRRCLLPHAATPLRPSFFKPVSSFNTKHSVGFFGLGSIPTVNALRRLGCFPNSAGLEKRRHRRLLVYASLEGNEYETDQEPAVESDPDSGATIDLKLPRRRLLVQFTCNECGERTSRLVNPVAYERGLIFVQCAGCLRHHKLVDNLGLVMEYDLREETNVKWDADQDMHS